MLLFFKQLHYLPFDCGKHKQRDREREKHFILHYIQFMLKGFPSHFLYVENKKKEAKQVHITQRAILHREMSLSFLNTQKKNKKK